MHAGVQNPSPSDDFSGKPRRAAALTPSPIAAMQAAQAPVTLHILAGWEAMAARSLLISSTQAAYLEEYFLIVMQLTAGCN